MCRCRGVVSALNINIKVINRFSLNNKCLSSGRLNNGFNVSMGVSGAAFAWVARARLRHVEGHGAIAIVAHEWHRMVVVIVVVALTASIKEPTSTSRRKEAAKYVVDTLSNARALTTGYGISSRWGCLGRSRRCRINPPIDRECLLRRLRAITGDMTRLHTV